MPPQIDCWKDATSTRPSRAVAWTKNVQSPGAGFRLSLPAVAERLVIHGGYLAYAGVIARLGGLVMAGNQALITVESICFLSADGFGIAAASVVGQSLGREDRTGARRAGFFGASVCAATLSALGAAIWVSGPWLLELFVPAGQDGRDLVRTGLDALPLLALSQPFMALAIVLGNALRGAGDTRSPLYAAALGGFLVRVALAWILGVHSELGLSGIWMASAADWMVRSLLLAGIFLRGRWATTSVA